MAADASQPPAPKKSASRVEPRTLRGMQDHLPADAMQRQALIATLCPIAERFGFVPLETPVLEHLDTLVGAGGENANKELFRLFSPEEEPIAMRFDLTVPFARLLAQYPNELKPPFRRYAYGPVFRADKPGPGRFRQFTQFDFDAAGSADVAVDAEICALLCACMKALGVQGYRLDVNSRRMMDALLVRAGIAAVEGQKAVLRVIDKVGKIGLENMRRELGPGRIDESGDPIKGLGLDPETIARIEGFMAVRAEGRVALLDALRPFLPETKEGGEALEEMRELDANLRCLGLGDDAVVFDPALARGLEYYTGPVFEMKLPQAPQFGTVMAGGRYDGLVERFTPNALAATGASIGVDRLLAALAHFAGGELPRTATQVLVTVFKGVPKAKYLELASELRAAGINTEVFFGKKKAGITDQLAHANNCGIPVAIIAGEDELSRGEVAVKDLVAGAQAREGIADHEAFRAAGKAGQVTVQRQDLVATIRGMFSAR